VLPKVNHTHYDDGGDCMITGWSVFNNEEDREAFMGTSPLASCSNELYTQYSTLTDATLLVVSGNGQRPKIENLEFNLQHLYEQDTNQYPAALTAKNGAVVRYSMVKRGGETKKAAFVELRAELSQCYAQILRGEQCSNRVVELVAHKADEADGCKVSTYSVEQEKKPSCESV